MTADVLASIDGALRDYETSGDAMRWTPDRVICDGGKPLYIGQRPSIGSQVRIVVDTTRAQEAFAEIGRQFQVFARAMQDAYVPMIKAACEAAHGFELAFRPALHRRQCSRCRPVAWPRPLCIDGHEYRRRQRNRHKRRR